MVPNLLPFSAAVTTGSGPTQPSVAGPVAEPGFAAMLGMATPPTSAAPASGVTAPVPVMPQGKAPLLGLTTDLAIAPVDAALPEQTEIADPIAVPVVPQLALAEPVAQPAVTTPAPPPAAEVTADPAPTAPAAKPKTNAPVPTRTPEGGSVTTVDGPRKTAVPNPVQIGETPTAGPAIATPIVKPPQPVAGTGGTVTTVDGPDKSVLTPTPTGSDTPVAPVAPVRKPVDPAPVAGPPGGTVTIVEPVRKAETPTQVQPKALPTPEDGSVTVTDGPRKPIINPVPEAPVETAPIAIEAIAVEPIAVEPVAVEPVAVEPVAVGPDTVMPAPVEDAAPQVEAAAEQIPAQPQMSVIASVSPAPITPVIAAPAAEPVPAPVQIEAQATAAAPVTLRVVEPAPADIASEAPVDDGAFDHLVTTASESDADALSTASDGAGDAMNRDGNRQPTPQPATPAPAAAHAAATPLPAFDPLAAGAANGATQTPDPAATEPRARASALGEDVGIAIVRHADSGSGDVLVIRLDPAELGKIEVRLRMDEARQLSAEVTADQPATLDLLRRDSDNLTRALNDAGFRADDQSLRFDSRGFGQSDQQAQQGRRVASRAYLSEGDAASARSTPTPVQVRSSGRVDLVA
ncbi:flagellar hook-length control protein FliK [Sphingomonas sp.]|uniref:flagellar hook-length control protein FliK n=1 Tax=Sphingomonas sp. TaxID=28214 RepID=UPI0017B608B5|nr:flagellar hook-length control protein FliK [Sphingomonas sp.]MBA4761559.1 flagellar hook-length control protein FliK [Sphingomonas sp.]